VITSAVKMSCPLTVERAVRCPAFFRGSKPLEPFLYYGRIFSVIVCVHLHVGRAYIYFITGALRKINYDNVNYRRANIKYLKFL